MKEHHDKHPKTEPLKPTHVVTHYIAAWRKHRRMTVQQVGEAAGLTSSMITQLEKGRSRYSQASLTAIAGALKVQPWQLLRSGPSDTLEFFTTSNYEELLRQIEAEDHPKVEVMLQSNIDAALNAARRLFCRVPDDKVERA